MKILKLLETLSAVDAARNNKHDKIIDDFQTEMLKLGFKDAIKNGNTIYTSVVRRLKFSNRKYEFIVKLIGESHDLNRHAVSVKPLTLTIEQNASNKEYKRLKYTLDQLPMLVKRIQKALFSFNNISTNKSDESHRKYKQSKKALLLVKAEGLDTDFVPNKNSNKHTIKATYKDRTLHIKTDGTIHLATTSIFEYDRRYSIKEVKEIIDFLKSKNFI